MCSIGSDKTSSVALAMPTGVGPGSPSAVARAPGARSVVAGSGRNRGTVLAPAYPVDIGSVLTGRIL